MDSIFKNVVLAFFSNLEFLKANFINIEQKKNLRIFHHRFDLLIFEKAQSLNLLLENDLK